MGGLRIASFPAEHERASEQQPHRAARLPTCPPSLWSSRRRPSLECDLEPRCVAAVVVERHAEPMASARLRDAEAGFENRSDFTLSIFPARAELLAVRSL